MIRSTKLRKLANERKEVRDQMIAEAKDMLSNPDVPADMKKVIQRRLDKVEEIYKKVKDSLNGKEIPCEG